MENREDMVQMPRVSWFLRRLASSGLCQAPLYSTRTFDFHSDRGLLYPVKDYPRSTNRGLGALGLHVPAALEGGQAFFLGACSGTKKWTKTTPLWTFQQCFAQNVQSIKMFDCLDLRVSTSILSRSMPYAVH